MGNEGPGKSDDFSNTDYSKWDYDRSWSSQERKSEVTTHDRSGKLDRSSWEKVQRVRDALLDGDAQSARYEEKIHERSGQSASIDYQEKANPDNFVMGNDAIEFVNKVKDQVRLRQKRMSNVAEADQEHSIIW